VKKLTLGRQTFREIVEGGHDYVDKTRYVYEMISGNKCYFLSRPRRFGKSLLLSTFEAVFGPVPPAGGLERRELFEGLWIGGSFEPAHGSDAEQEFCRNLRVHIR
jgi:hypothetical protein